MNTNRKWTIIFGGVLLILIGGLLLQGKMYKNDELPMKVSTDVEKNVETASVESKEDSTEPPREEEKDEKDEKKANIEKSKKENSESDSSDKSSTEKHKEKKVQDLPKQSTIKKKTSKSKVNEENRSSSVPHETTEKPSGAVTTNSPATHVPQEKTCRLFITCKEVFSHMDKLSESAKRVIPQDGNILSGTYKIQEGDTVFDVLKRACEEKGILLDYVFTPMYSTYYIKGIHNLYEFDCGEESGWLYTVNGQNPGYGSSQYQLEGGEEVIFNYACEK